jgi:hypothetical protein
MATPTFSDSVGQFRGLAGELVAEWRRELVRFAREALASPLARGGELVLLDVEADEAIVKLVSGEDVHEIGRASGLGEGGAREISSLLAASELVPRGTADIAVELPDDDVLRRRFELPAASRTTLARAVPFELERFNPIYAVRRSYDLCVLSPP